MLEPVSKERLVMPAEWAPHHSVWMAWPYREQDWPGTLAEARAEVTGLCAAIAAELPAESPTGPLPPAETIEMMVATQECERDAAGALSGLPVRLHRLSSTGLCITHFLHRTVFLNKVTNLDAHCNAYNSSHILLDS